MDEIQSGVVTPEVPVVTPPAADAVIAPDTPAGQDQAQEPVKPRTYTEDEHKELVAKNVSERLAKARRQIAREEAAKAEAAFYKRQLEERDRVAQAPAKSEGEPQFEDFNGDPKAYMRAFLKWELKQEQANSQREYQTEAEQRQAAEEAQIARERLSAGAEKYEDYDEVTSDKTVPITGVMAKAIIESDMSADLNYYLCTHREEALQIAKMAPTRQAIAIGKLEDKLKAPPKPTQTPPPIKPLDGNAGAKRDWADLSTAEHVEKWLKRKR
jgi:hypothetical protein